MERLKRYRLRKKMGLVNALQSNGIPDTNENENLPESHHSAQ